MCFSYCCSKLFVGWGLWVVLTVISVIVLFRLYYSVVILFTCVRLYYVYSRSPPGEVCEGVPSVAGVGVVPGVPGGFWKVWVTDRNIQSVWRDLSHRRCRIVAPSTGTTVKGPREGRLSIGRSLS